MVSIFHAHGVTLFAYALQCKSGWLPAVDIVFDETSAMRHQRVDVYPTPTAALLVSFGDATHLASEIRRAELRARATAEPGQVQDTHQLAPRNSLA